MIPFNRPYITGHEVSHIKNVLYSRRLSGDGCYTKKCQKFFEDRYNFKKVLLTTSCTDALEMCALLIDIKLGDEVIIPSYTFVSTALAFIRQGATIVFADSKKDNPNIDEDSIEQLITPKTKAIVPVHYAGTACNMKKIMEIAKKYDLIVIEDAAQAIDSYYEGKPLGSIGHLATFSFHETKNISCGEGGLLIINDDRFINRAEIIWEKGTDRAKFFRGEIDKYGWVDIGSSFLPSEIVAAHLYAQLKYLDKIQNRRKYILQSYYEGLKDILPIHTSTNAHMAYSVCENRSKLIKYLKSKGIQATFHYSSLHKSKYYRNKYIGKVLSNADYFSDHLIRLPLYYDLNEEEINFVINTIKEYK